MNLEHTENLEDEEVPVRFRDHAWFVGFAPVEAPEIVVAVIVEHGGHGGSVAAPITRRVLERYFEKRTRPEGPVAPVTAVRYRELDGPDGNGGAEHRVELLGPWDLEEEHQVSYRSPIAKGLLGCEPGDEATLELPVGALRVEILAVEPLDLGS